MATHEKLPIDNKFSSNNPPKLSIRGYVIWASEVGCQGLYVIWWYILYKIYVYWGYVLLEHIFQISKICPQNAHFFYMLSEVFLHFLTFYFGLTLPQIFGASNFCQKICRFFGQKLSFFCLAALLDFPLWGVPGGGILFRV